MSQDPKVKLPAIPLGRDRHAGVSRARSGERKPSKKNIVLIVALDPAHKAGLVGHVPVKSHTAWRRSL